MISAILLAGGSSRRMGPGIDKLMHEVNRKPLLAHVLCAFQNSSGVDEIILVGREDRKDLYRSVALKSKISKLKSVVSGGLERQDSVWCGLQEISDGSEVVLIHDAARALVTPTIISRCIQGALDRKAVIPAVPIKDTIKRVASLPNGLDYLEIQTTVERSQLWAAQTPQTFRTELIRKAYEPLIKDKIIVTDDAAAVERLGVPVYIVESDPLNLKVTTTEDLLLAEVILAKKQQS
jgi:2-C-methyl-D-erythritol 4-phosphate cytidylyltransferase